MEVKLTSMGDFKVEFSLNDLGARAKADLLRKLMDESGLLELVLAQGKKDESFAHEVDVAFERFSGRMG